MSSFTTEVLSFNLIADIYIRVGNSFLLQTLRNTI